MCIDEELSRASHLASLSNHELIKRLKSWAARERRVTLGVLFLLNEVESRKLHLDRYSSLFAYCTDRLGYSRSAAGRRIAAARCLRQYPEIIPMLADGRLNLTTLGILSRVLTPENSREVLARAAGASQEEAERIAAEYGKPRPARDRIKPVRSLTNPGAASNGAGSCDGMGAGAGEAARMPRASNVAGASETPGGPADLASTAVRAATAESMAGGQAEPHAQPDEPPLSQPMYDIAFRASAELVEKLRRAQDLLASAHADPSLAVVIDRAVEMLLDRHDPVRRQARRDARAAKRDHNGSAETTQDACGSMVKRSGANAGDGANAGSGCTPYRETDTDSLNGTQRAASEAQLPRSAARRAIPQEVRDKVFLAYGNRCAHLGPEGRCPETRNLDLDHVVPIAQGGTDDPDNLRPACRGHNQRFADLTFGREFMNKHRYGNPILMESASTARRGQLEPIRQLGVS